MLIVPALHPAFLLRSSDGDQGQSKFFDTTIKDVAKARRLQWRRPSWDEGVIWSRDEYGRLINLYPTAAEVLAFCRRVFERKLLLVVDVESTGEEPLACQLICIGMAASDGSALCFPVLRTGGASYWSEEDWPTVRAAIAFLLGNSSVPKCFHNGPFDTVVLWAHGLSVGGWAEDTLLAQHVVDGEMPKSLAYVSSVHLEVPFWKEVNSHGQRWIDIPDLDLRSYNIRDCLATLRVLPPLLDRLRELGIESLYREEVANAQIMAGATVRGLEIDLNRRDDTTIDTAQTRKDGTPNPDFGKPKGLGPRLRQQRDVALKTLRSIAGSDTFNPRSPIHLRYFLFDLLKFPIVSRTDKGAPSTDKNAMILLSLNADTPAQQQALRALVDYRAADKMLGTWVEGLPVLWDGRVHASWKVHGTVSGRFSSSPNCFDAATEILTQRGWLRFADLSNADLVAQWEDGAISFVRPLRYIAYEYSGQMHHMKNDHIDLRVTDDHRCLVGLRSGQTEVVRPADYVEDRKQINAGMYGGGVGVDLSRDEMIVLCAVQADASTKAFCKYRQLRFGFSKHRKISRLIAALSRLGVAYTLNETTDRPYRASIIVKRCALTEKLALYLDNEKAFFPWIPYASRDQLDWFCEEIWHWDGCFTRMNYYSSSIARNAEWVQIALTLSGQRAHLRTYMPPSGNPNFQVDVTHRDYSWTTNIDHTVEHVREMVYCVEVPSSYIVVRRDRKVAITGNCQNLNKAIKKIFRARTGWKYVSVDLSQAEVRMMAYLSGDPDLIEMYKQGINVHTVTASMLFQVKCPKPDDTNAATEAFLLEACKRLLGLDYNTFPMMAKSKWKPTRTLAKNTRFGWQYGAEASTIYEVIRSKRDPDTNDVLFPDITLGEVEAMKLMMEQINAAIPKWWKKITEQTMKAQRYQCPISGRIHWYRGGFKRNEMLNRPIQTAIASWMNRNMIPIAEALERETCGRAGICQQVHDAITVEAPDADVPIVSEILGRYLNQPFNMPGLGMITLPADAATVGQYMDEV